MKKVLLSAVAASLLALAASAHEYTAGSLKIVHPYARETPPAATVGSAYLAVANAGATSDRLVGGRTPRAERVEIHTMVHEGNVMKMRPLPNGLDIPASQTVTLAPGGLHLMLLGLGQPLREGERIPMVLTFERAGDVAVELEVQKVGAAATGHDPHDMPAHK